MPVAQYPGTSPDTGTPGRSTWVLIPGVDLVGINPRGTRVRYCAVVIQYLLIRFGVRTSYCLYKSVSWNPGFQAIGAFSKTRSSKFERTPFEKNRRIASTSQSCSTVNLSAARNVWAHNCGEQCRVVLLPGHPGGYP
eukprot:1290171-Rhodomonas_salina.2